jgi:hypothetical protein
VSLRITDDNDGLESGTLTGTGLLLNGLDLEGKMVSSGIFQDLRLCANLELP